MRVVVIDDDRFVCTSLKIILEAEEDIQVEATGTEGEEAVQLCRKLRPDIMLMDIQMPEMSGLEAGRQILQEFPDIVTKLPGLMSHKEDGGGNVPYTLKPRELEIISLVAEGLSNREISGRLYLSEGTVRNYLSTILEKLELRDRTQLAVFYYKKLKNGMSVNQ